VACFLKDTIHKTLWVSGIFTETNAGRPDSVNCSGIAMWNDTTWSTNFFIKGYHPTITSTVIYKGKVYAGSNDGLVLVNDTLWKVIGNFDDVVGALAVYNDKLYAGGDFQLEDTLSVYHIACYDGIKWSKVGHGVYWAGSVATVSAMAVWENKLYIGGA